MAALSTGGSALVRRPPQLRLHHAVSGRITRGETHSYRLDLRLGQRVRIEVFQHEIDLAVAVRRPDGSRLPAMDGSQWSWEGVSLRARTFGTHEIEVISPIDDTAMGLYTLVVTKVSIPTGNSENSEAGARTVSTGSCARPESTG